MRTRILAAVLVIGATVVAVSATRDTPVRRTLVPRPPDAEVALTRVLSEVQLYNVPFDEALERLKGLAQTEFLVDWAQLEDNGFDRKAPVRLVAKGIPLADALSRLLSQVPHEPGPPVEYAPDGGAIMISRRDVLARRVMTRAYDVHDLVSLSPLQPPPAPARGLFGNPPPRPGHSEAAENLIRLIVESVDTDTWQQAGGTIGQARVFAGRLVVVSTWDTHRKVEEFLASLQQPVPAIARPAAEEWIVWDPRLQRWTPSGPDAAGRALQKVLPEVRIENGTLGSAIDTLTRLAGTPIRIDLGVLNPWAFDPRAQRSVHARDVTLQRALDLVVDRWGEWGIGYSVRDGEIVILNHHDLDRHTITRVYDLRDWPHVGAAVDRQRPPETDETGLPRTRENDVTELVRVLTSAIEPDSWRVNGGPGQTRVVDDRLVIIQTWRNHEKVRRFMDLMRANPPNAPAAPASAPSTRPN